MAEDQLSSAKTSFDVALADIGLDSTHTTSYLSGMRGLSDFVDEADDGQEEEEDGAECDLLDLGGVEAADASLLSAEQKQEQKQEMAKQERDPAAGSSMAGTGLAIAKSFVGPAVLYLPHGFQQGGKVFAPIVLFLAWALCMYGSFCLLQCWRQCQHMGRRSFDQMVLRILGKPAMLLVRACLLLNQVGIALTYYLFVAVNVNDLLARWAGGRVAIGTIVWLQVAVQAPLSWVRQIHRLEPTTILADVGIVFGLTTILCVCVARIARDGSTLGAQPAFNQRDFPMFIGTSVFCFEGLALTIPLQVPGVRGGGGQQSWQQQR
jgi:proton-coupled amino acid transporter